MIEKLILLIKSFLNLLIFFSFFSTNLLAQEFISIVNETSEISINPFLEIFEDTSGNLTIQEINSTEYDSLFKTNFQDVPNFGFTESVYWVKFKINSEDLRNFTPWVLEVVYPNIHFVDLYQFNSQNQIVNISKTGVMRDTKTRDYKFHHLVFLLPLNRQSKSTIYLKFQTETSMTIDLRLWQMNSFLTYGHNSYIIIGVFVGILLLMIGYSLFNYFSLKDKISLYFAFAILTLLAFAISYNGLGHIYIWPDFLNLKAISIPLFTCLLGMSFLLFTKEFLFINQNHLILNRIINTLVSFLFLIFILTFVLPYRNIIKPVLVLNIFSAFLVIFSGFHLYKKGFKPAFYFVIGSVPILVLAIILVSVRFNLLPSQIITEQGYLFAVLFFSITFVHEINRSFAN